MSLIGTDNSKLTRAATASAIAGLSDIVLETLATRSRAAGGYLVALDRQGTVVFHDAMAAPFYVRYVLAMLRSPGYFEAQFKSAVEAMTIGMGPQVWDWLPGAHIAAVPYVEKRQVIGVILSIIRTENYTIGEDIQREASRLGFDSIWLATQAAAVEGGSSQMAVAASKMLLAMIKDQVRLVSGDTEIQSLSTQLANSYEELSLIYQISGGMKVNRGASEFFRQACLDVCEVMSVRAVGYSLKMENNARHDPAIVGEHSLSAEALKRLTDELIDVLRVRKSALFVTDIKNDKRFAWLTGQVGQILAVPLQRQEQVLGCLFALDKPTGEFDSVDGKLLNSIANESAIYLENSMLFEDVRDLMWGVLHSLTSAVDAKDAYTCGHSERVALFSKRLAREIGLPEQQIERIYMAGILHDVGKIGVPEAVLHKTGKLTNEEFDQMKKHPQIGARILADIKQVEDLIPGVLYHHERYDGKGYPARLSGEKIPMPGRIICVSDCFDAMTSNRTYRRALPLEVAMIEVRRCAGTQFDPALAEAFLRIDRDEIRTLIRDHQAHDVKPLPSPDFGLKKT